MDLIFMVSTMATVLSGTSVSATTRASSTADTIVPTIPSAVQNMIYLANDDGAGKWPIDL